VCLFVVAAGRAALTALDRMPPALLLAFTFALGAGQAVTLPTWQAIIPEVVPREELPAASALGAVNTNLARSAGPAIAGLLVAHVGPAAVFGLNALSFAGSPPPCCPGTARRTAAPGTPSTSVPRCAPPAGSCTTRGWYGASCCG